MFTESPNRVFGSLLLLLSTLLAPIAAGGQPSGNAPTGEDLKVYLQTVGPGANVWEHYGHNSLVVEDTRTGRALSFNYGIFLKPDPGVFLSGNMVYIVAPIPAAEELAEFREYGRDVWRHEVNLTPQQRVELLTFLEWNCAEENRDYLYNYYRDNCSTRVRDALDRALGGVIKEQSGAAAEHNFRWHSQRMSQFVWANWAGIQMGQGLSVDEPITVWDEMFLPGILQRHLAKMTVPMPDGTRAPLLLAEEKFPALPGADVTVLKEPEEPPSWTLWHILVGLLASGAVLELARSGRKKLLATFAFLWLLVNGLVGCLIVYLWWGSLHADSAANMNLFYYTPLSLVLLPLFLMHVLAGKCTRAAFVLSHLVTTVAVLGLLLELIPALSQTNGALIGLALPMQAAVALATRESVNPPATSADAS